MFDLACVARALHSGGVKRGAEELNPGEEHGD